MSKNLLALFIVTALSTVSAPSAHAFDYLGSCTVTPSTATVSCSNSDVESIVWVESSSSKGVTLGLGMKGVSKLDIIGSVSAGSGWLLNLGDSETNNGYCGDAATTSNDSELWLSGTNLYLCDSDRGGSRYLWSYPSAVPTTGSYFITVTDGTVTYSSSSTSTYVTKSSSTIFQFTGDEPDAEAGINDTYLWLGLNRVISGPGARTGTGLGTLTLFFWD